MTEAVTLTLRAQDELHVSGVGSTRSTWIDGR